MVMERESVSKMTVSSMARQIRGERRHGVESFRSVYYAEPPTGELRFLPAVPKESWSPAVMDATRYGPSSQ